MGILLKCRYGNRLIEGASKRSFFYTAFCVKHINNMSVQTLDFKTNLPSFAFINEEENIDEEDKSDDDASDDKEEDDPDFDDDSEDEEE